MIHRRLACLVVSAAALAVGAPAATALEPGYTLNISGPSTAIVGAPVVFQATGSNPSDDFFTSWLDVDAIPASVVSTCPDGYLTASQLADTTGGDHVTVAQREDADAAGHFSMPFGYTPKAPGRLLICGYTNDGATSTRAISSLVLDVGPAGGGGANVGGGGGAVAKPANTSKPRLTRSGKKLVCQAGTWSSSSSGYSYSWLVNGKKKKGATGRKLSVTRSLRGRKVQCKVTAFNAGGSATAVSKSVRVT